MSPLCIPRKEAARLLSVSVKTLNRLVDEGLISPPILFGPRAVRFELAKLKADIARLGGTQIEGEGNPWNEVL